MKPELIQAIKTNLHVIRSFDVENDLIRVQDLGSELNFQDAEEDIRRIISLFDLVKPENLKLVTESQLTNFHSHLTAAIELLKKIKNFKIGDGSPSRERLNIKRELVTHYNNYYESALPLLVDQLFNNQDSGDISELKSDILAYKASASDTVEEIKETLRTAKEATAEIGVSRYAVIFNNQSKWHQVVARWWLCFTVLSILACVIAAIWMIKYYPSDSMNTTYVIQYTLSKLVILSALFYTISLCNRNYKAHRHNELLNRHRQNALSTFEAFSNASGSDTQTKNAVLLEATRTIFSNQQTGYLSANSDTDSSNKIIEIFKSVSSKED